jgi:hypothetical protein
MNTRDTLKDLADNLGDREFGILFDGFDASDPQVKRWVKGKENIPEDVTDRINFTQEIFDLLGDEFYVEAIHDWLIRENAYIRESCPLTQISVDNFEVVRMAAKDFLNTAY